MGAAALILALINVVNTISDASIDAKISFGLFTVSLFLAALWGWLGAFDWLEFDEGGMSYRRFFSRKRVSWREYVGRRESFRGLFRGKWDHGNLWENDEVARAEPIAEVNPFVGDFNPIDKIASIRCSDLAGDWLRQLAAVQQAQRFHM